MRRAGTVILLCAAMIGVRGMAQTASGVSAEIRQALAREWKDTALYAELDFDTGSVGPVVPGLSAGPDPKDGITHCLNALERYTALLPPQRDLDMALQELGLGIKAPPQRPVILLGWAKDLNIDVAKALAEASTRTLDKNNTAAATPVFLYAKTGIETAYRHDDAGVATRLKDSVNKEITAKNYPRALYELLRLTYDFRTNLFPAPANPVEKAIAQMEVYRMCYAYDADKLFKLVSDLFKSF